MSMYRWRRLSEEDRAKLLACRQKLERPWHSPPHFIEGPGQFHLTAACYEHASIIGASINRMQQFSSDLLGLFDELKATTHAWCVLPNHYHVLVHVHDLHQVVAALGRLHGRTSHAWNGEDNLRGRKVWSAPADRFIQNAGHFWATVNYIHHNPVKHGHVQKWQE